MSIARIRQHPWCSAALLVLVALVGVGLQAYLFRTYFVDDAYITLRFVENWLRGRGLVFNAGEWVEGYSCPLYVWLLGAVGLVYPDLPRIAWAIGSASWIAAIVLSGYTAHLIGLRKAEVLIAPALVAACAGYGFFAVTGMETAFYA